MIFHEIYGVYYAVTGALLDFSKQKAIDLKTIAKIASEKAFAESAINIEVAIKSGSWHLWDKKGYSVLRHRTYMPITQIEEEWLAALSDSEQFQLFGAEVNQNSKKLFRHGIFTYFDQDSDGDPYNDLTYQENFRIVINAIKQRNMLRITYRNKKKIDIEIEIVPEALEYSQKNNKFRIVGTSEFGESIINLASVQTIEEVGGRDNAPRKVKAQKMETVELRLIDQKGALDRAMHQFADLKKETTKIGTNVYRIMLCYRKIDEAEIAIRILSFGDLLQVMGDSEIANDLHERAIRQVELFTSSSADTLRG